MSQPALISPALISNDTGTAESISWIKTQAPLSKIERITIYKNSWWNRLVDSIADDYPRLVKSLGNLAFHRLLRAYLKDCPPHSYTLVHAGDRLPEFLKDCEVWGEGQPWLVDLARMERAEYQAYHAADPFTWEPDWLSQLTLESASLLRLRIQPSVTLLESQWKIAKFLKGKRLNPGAHPEEKKICLQEVSYLVIYRNGYSSTYQKLRPLQYQLLQLAKKGATLNEWADCAGLSIAWLKWLKEWTKRGIIYPEVFER